MFQLYVDYRAEATGCSKYEKRKGRKKERQRNEIESVFQVNV